MWFVGLLRRVLAILLVFLVLAAALPFLVPLVRPWSRINCVGTEINIQTGQKRHIRYVWFVKFSGPEEDTPLSLALGGEVVKVSAREPWYPVYTRSIGMKHSPHYRFHGALFQASDFQTLATLYNVSAGEKRDLARQILTEWQRTGRDDSAGDILRTVAEKLEDAEPSGGTPGP